MKRDVLNSEYLLLILAAILYYADGANSRPVCSKSYYSANVLEGTKMSASVINVTCSDPDNDVLTYVFDISNGGNTNSTFKLNPTTGELTLNKDADAEQAASGFYSYPFTMRVLVKDSITSPLAITMFVYITDINDNNPTITGLPSTKSIAENSAVGTLLATCTLQDLDYKGGGNEVAFVRIIGGDPNGTFSIDYRRCILMLVRSLDFETTTKYFLVLQTYDIGLNAPNSRSTSVTLTVSVTDVNDNQPTCSAYNLIRDVDETASLGSVLAQLNCTDKESKTSLKYAITSRVPTTDTRLKVNSTTGAVTLTGALDYEKNDRKLEIKIQVSDTGFATVMSTIVTVVFRVTDADDNPPLLDTLYVGYISENANIGTYILTINATDVDSPNTPLSKITFGFENNCSQSNWFKIDSYTGTIFVNSLLDWETAPNVTCKVFAYSSNQYAKRRISDVVIFIQDVNDREPGFTKYLFEGFVFENSPLGISVAHVKAVDPDSGINGIFNFSLPHSKQFIINPTTGEITLNDSMDYEAEISYLVLVEARDFGIPTFSSQTYVNIKVLPVNEFSPVFAHQVGTQTVSEGAEIGSVLVNILATDDDHGLDGQIIYSLLDDTVPFILESDKGDLVVRLGLDAETTRQYNVTVIASDLSETSPRSISMSFLVNVLDVNDNPPWCEFPGPLQLKSPTALTPVMKLNCSDPDTSSPVLRYEIMGGNSNNVFRIDPATAEISLPTVDIDAVDEYLLLVRVTDNGLDSKFTTFTFEVNLEIDLQFIDFPGFPVHLNENADVSTTVVNVTTTGAYDVVSYKILTGDVEGQFSINKYSGQLVLAKSLDRETLDHYTLAIEASTPSGQVLVKSLDIIVDDHNDNVPTFPNSRYERRVLEGVALPKSLGLITAVDKDKGNNSLLAYYFCSSDYDIMFGINAATGEITVKGALDSESTPAYNLIVCVKDGGDPTLSSSTTVFVSIENEDEFKPSIQTSGGSINITLSEDAAIGSTVLVINGSDPDRGSELIYEIFNGGPFAINEHTGEVYLVYPLDREALSIFTFTVSVTDTNGHSAKTTVFVNVTDVNDNDPVFDPQTYVFEASHGTVPNTKVGQFIVKDIDVGVNSTLVLSITSGDTGGFFAISGLSLVSKKQLDANFQNQYILTVTATDSGNPPRSSSTFVTVNIEPEFKQPSFEQIIPNPITLPEDKVVGSLIISVSATKLGAAEGADGDLLYIVLNGDPYANFRIEPFGGEIQLISPLEYARKSFFSLLVLAVNRYQPSYNSTVLLNITVLQVNLYTPQFGLDVYNWTVNETAIVGSSIGQVSATDNDVGLFGRVAYSMKSGFPFHVNSNTGGVILNSKLEYSQTKSYSFYVTAIDNAGASSKTSSAVVFIYVIDFNNHAPAFMSSTYSLTLPESFPLYLIFHGALAHDSDSGLFGLLEYSITEGNTANVFGINQTTGALSLLKKLDFESDKTFLLTVRASDGGNPSLSGTTSVTISVEDVNDNAPMFSTRTVDLSIQQTLPALSLIYSASASDKESGINGAFSYIISSGNEEGLFTIDTLNGQLRTARTLPSSGGFYTLTVAAVDRGWPSLTGTVMVRVAITPVTGLPVDMSVSENEPSGTHVGYITHSSSVTGFTISGGNYLQAFTISNATGELKTFKPLDREIYSLYQLSVMLWNHDNVDSTVTLKIKVLDENDNAPKFSARTQTLKIVENMPTGSSVGQLSAQDIDEPGPNSEVTYTMLPSPGGQFFLVDGLTGTLRLKQGVNYETVSSLVLEVMAKDNGSPQMSSTATVFVVVYDVPETVTKHGFNTSYYISHEFPYDAVKSDVVCSLAPEDFGLDPKLNSITGVTSVGDNVFSVSSSGEVKVNMANKMFEHGRYIQWMVLTASGKTESLVGLLRLDTFNKDKHLVAVVTSLDEADLSTKIDVLRQDLQAKFPAPNKVKIWQVQATTSNSNRRRLLAAESAALTVVLADGSADSKDNVEMDKSFLTQSQILSKLQQSPDGTPVSGLSSNVPITKVVPYQDASQESSQLDTTTIVLIVFGILAAIIAIGIAAIVTYYCFKRRKIAEDKLGLVQRDTTTQSTETMNQEKITYSSFPEDTDIDDHIDDYDPSSTLLTDCGHSQSTDVQPSDRTLEVRNIKGASPILAQYISTSFPHRVDPNRESLRTVEVNNMESPKPLKATYISSTYTDRPHPPGTSAGVKNSTPVVNHETSHNSIVATFISSSYVPKVESKEGLPEVEEMTQMKT